MKKLFLLPIVLESIFSAGSVFGQTKSGSQLRSGKKNQQERWEAGILAGLSFYKGDLSAQNIVLRNGGGGGGLFARYRFSDAVATRANLQFGSISGKDSNFDEFSRRVRDFSFVSNFYDFGLLAEFEPFGKLRLSRSENAMRFVSPYFHCGFSGVLSVPLVDFNEPNPIVTISDIHTDKTKSSFFHLGLPVGAGLRYDLNSNWMLGLEACVRHVFTDYLDGISKAGNPAKKDWIGTANLVLGYRFVPYRDKDGDGIPNELDACPTDPGSRKTKGCPDRDKDGIVDQTDRCPDEVGSEKTFGCPDRDGDGIADELDNCPNVIGVESEAGCPDTDLDRDGVPDYRDNCPDRAGIVSQGGCPDIESAGAEKARTDSLQQASDAVAGKKNPAEDLLQPPMLPTIGFLATAAGDEAIAADFLQLLKEAESGISFDRSEAVIKPEAAEYLDRIVKMLVFHPSYRLRITGYCEESSSKLQNVVLSVSRAKVVYEYLVQKGIDFRRLNFLGSGSSR